MNRKTSYRYDLIHWTTNQYWRTQTLSREIGRARIKTFYGWWIKSNLR